MSTSEQDDHGTVEPAALGTDATDHASIDRRQFLGSASALALGVGTFTPSLHPVNASDNAQHDNPLIGNATSPRAETSFQIRVTAAQIRRNAPRPQHRTNGDETRYSNRIGSFSKGLPHNEFGEVDSSAYSAYLKATNTRSPSDFEKIPLGGPRKLINPQSGLAFDLQGFDSAAVTSPSAPALSSAEIAGEAVEAYWAAHLRDLHLNAFESSSDVASACNDLNSVSVFKGPKQGGLVTPLTIFRDPLPGANVGPYISQFMVLPTPFGAEFVDRRARVFVAGSDHATDFDDWLTLQNGGINESSQFDTERRYLRNGRDLAAWVQNDDLIQAHFNASLILGTPPSSFDENSGGIAAPPNAGDPYRESSNQTGFGTFGSPAVRALISEVSASAIKAAWFQKWFLHRRLRPEAFGGLVHLQKTRNRYPGILHSDILNSSGLATIFEQYGTYLLPMAYPEGSPMHPSYTSGHATVAGACVTILKAFFDETFVIPNPVVASADGLSTEPYSGPPLTVGGELNKLASNIGAGRIFAGLNWRSDTVQSFRLGEKIAISILEDQRSIYNENRGGLFRGFTFTKFDGSTVTV